MARSIIQRIISAFDRPSARKAEQEMAESMGRAGAEGGKKAGTNYIRDLRREFDKRKADLQVALARGTISEKEFRKQTALAEKTFREGILRLMDEAKKKGKEGEAEYIKLSRALKRVGDEGRRSIGTRLTDALKKAAAAAAALFGIRQIIRFGRESIRAADALRATQRSLEQQLRNVGVAWDDVSHEVRQHARALWDTHRLTAGEVMDTLRQLIVITGDYQTALRAVGTVHNIVKATGLGVEQATRLLGRAMNGEITVFNRYGVMLDATRDILEQLDERFHGAALAGTTAGEALSKAWGDFKETFGEALLGVAEGESVLDRVTRAVRWMSDNIDELLHTVKALTIAIGIMIGVRGLAGMVMAFRGATAAAVTFRTVLQGLYAMLGPKGWLILGVAALTEAIRRKGAAAREAARDVEEWRQSLRAMSLGELEKELVEVSRQRREVEEQLQRFERQGRTRLANDARRRLEIIRQGGLEIIRLMSRLRSEQERVIPDPDDEPTRAGPADTRFADRSAQINQEIADLRRLQDAQRESARAVEDLQRTLQVESAVRQATAGLREQDAAQIAELIRLREAERDALAEMEQAAARGEHVAAMERDIEVLRRRAEAVRQGEDAVNALNRELAIEEAVLRSGAEAGSEYAAQIRDLAAAHFDAAQQVESAWVDALQTIDEEAHAVNLSIASLFQAWASGGIGSVARLAKAKVVENLAWAAENFARAMGWVALGNVPSAAAARQAAGQHLAAAAKWGVAGAVAGSAAGGAGAGPTLSGPRQGVADSAERPGAEVHIHFVGPGFDAVNPAVQKVVWSAMTEGQERFGPNARIHTHRTG